MYHFRRVIYIYIININYLTKQFFIKIRLRNLQFQNVSSKFVAAHCLVLSTVAVVQQHYTYALMFPHHGLRDKLILRGKNV